MKANTISTALAGVLLTLAAAPAWPGSWNPTSSDSNNNTAGGSSALSGVTGSNNTGFGYGSLYKTTSGYSNTGIGVYSLLNNTTGYGNTAAGLQSLNSNTTGSYNTATGTYALYGNTTGIHNAAIGLKSLTGNTTGGYNVALGNGTLQSNTTGAYNTAVGYSAGNLQTTGGYNTAVGYNAGYNQTTGSYNLYLANAGVAAEGYTTRIGDKQTAAYLAGVYGKSTSDSASSVAVYIDKNGKLGTLLSSQRYKDDIRDMREASRRLYELRPVTYHYKKTAGGDQPLEYGLIAEEVEKIYPDLVVHDGQGQIQTVQYHKLTPMLLNEMQQLNADLKAEKAKSAALADTLKAEQARNQSQTREIAELKQQAIQVETQARQLQTLAVRLQALESKQPVRPVGRFGGEGQLLKP